MDHPSLLEQAFVFLVASVVSVPLAKRLGLGAVLGYLLAGAAIGPWGLGLFGDPESLMHTAEFGVVIMLFLIGLELEPALLWRMRQAVLGLGGSQVLACGVALAAAAMAFGLDWRVALICGFTLSLSSTAIVVQTHRERGLANTDVGRSSFGVLLFQDVAVIPMLAVFPLLAGPGAAVGEHASAISVLPAWLQTLAVLGVVGGIVALGRWVAQPLFRLIARADVREIFTAAGLALVVGVSLLMQAVGLSPALGAFVAGVVLAESEFRHEIESDIEPFRALLLGLFFLSVGADIDFGLILSTPATVAMLVAALIAVKAIVIFAVARAWRRPAPDAVRIALSLAQGGEFAFVLLAAAAAANAVPRATIDLLVATVALSMALAPVMISLGERLSSRLDSAAQEQRPVPEPLEIEHPTAIVAGYGRFGQIVTRFLKANGYTSSILEHNARQVELVRSFRHKANYGDASRVELLRAAGAEEARLLVVAVDDQQKAIEIVETARRHFPHLHVLARAYDRLHAFELMKRGIAAPERETFEGGLHMGMKALRALGQDVAHVERAGRLFRVHDYRQVREMAGHWNGDEGFDAYRSAVNARAGMLEEAMRRDISNAPVSVPEDICSSETLEQGR